MWNKLRNGIGSIAVSTALVMAAVALPTTSANAWDHGGRGWHGGCCWGGWGWGVGAGIAAGVAVGSALSWPGYYYPYGYPYPYAYAYPDAYAYPAPAVTVVQPVATPAPVAAAPAATPAAEPAGQSYYYCGNPKGYYPYVRDCKTAWQAVPATPPGATR
jgi:hypothetical protein